MKYIKNIKRSTLFYGGAFFAAGLISFVLRLREPGTNFTDAFVWLLLGAVLFRNAILEDRCKAAQTEMNALKERH